MQNKVLFPSKTMIAMSNYASIQRAISLTQNIYPASSLFNVGGYAYIKGNVDEARLLYAIKVILNGTDIVTTYDIASIDNISETQCQQWMEQDMQQALDMQQPLLKIRIIKCDSNTWYWYTKAHHLIFDGYSMALFFNKVSAAYDGNEADQQAFRYQSFIEEDQRYRSSIDFIKDRSFWINKLKRTINKAFQTCTTPTSANDISSKRRTLNIPRQVYNAINDYCTQYHCTPFHYFISALFVLNYYYGNESTVIALPVFNRSGKSFKETIGTFVNILPFFTELKRDQTFQQLLLQVKNELKDHYKHHRYPLSDLLEDLNQAGNIYNISFSYQKNTYSPALGGHPTTITYLHSGEQQEDLVFHLLEYAPDQDLTLSLDYRKEAFTPAVIDQVLVHFEHLITSLYQHPQQRLDKISCIKADEQQHILSFNPAPQPVPTGTIITDFEIQAAKHPTAPALLVGDKSITYGELNERASQLAATLQAQHHLHPGDLVGVRLKRDEQLIISLLAILKTGAAYVPIDPAYPQERIDYIIADAGCKIILEQTAVITLPHSKPVQPGLAYVIYTSGSTGKPKGVMIHHNNVYTFIKWCEKEFANDTFDTIFAVTSVCFDLSIFEIFFPICTGRKFRLLDNALEIDNYLHTSENILLNTVPSVIGMLLHNQADLSNVTVINMAGEPLPSQHLEKLDLHRIAVRNLYGPSEDTTYSTVYTCKKVSPVLIGKPITNTRAYILNPYGQLLPPGIAGEICLAGAGLSKGYLHNATLTAEKFLQDPFHPDENMYLTGDTGYWLPDGNIALLGRKDNQVKIRGYRIELGEIENTLRNYAGIASTAVTIINGEEIAAYYTGKQAFTTNGVREYLAQYLPAFMLPTHYVQLPSLPLTANGKIDKKKLPVPAATNFTHEYITDDTSRQLLEMWQEILGRENISLHDNFFETGGHSLKAARLAGEIHKVFNVKIDLKDIFRLPTIEEQAILVKNASKNVFSHIVPVTPQPDYPISSAQHRIWVASQLQEGNKAYNMPAAFVLEGDLDKTALQNAFTQLVKRYEILRTVFRANKHGELRQMVLPPFEVQLYQGTDSPESIFSYLFDLENGPLFRATLYQTAHNKHVFTFVMHHIISDGWSIHILIKELLHRYNNGEENLAPLKVQYKDYVHWQQTLSYHDHKNYWLQQFRDELPVLELPVDKPRTQERTFNGSSLTTVLPATFHQFCREQNVTLFMGLTALVTTLLHRYTGQQDLVIGTLASGREHPDLKDQIGCYLHTLPLRFRWDDHTSFADLLQHTRQVTFQAFEHQEYPFERLIDDLHLQHARNRHPLFDVTVVLQNTGDAYLDQLQHLNGLHVSEYPVIDTVSKFDLSFDFSQHAAGIHTTINYNTDLFTTETISRLSRHLNAILLTATSHPDKPISQLDYLSQHETHQILHDFNNTSSNYPYLSIGELFKQQAEKTPFKPALNSLTYQELDEQSDKLAAYLQQEYHLQHEEPVGILMDRSEQTIIAVLAVIKAGGAYMPIETDYPGSRKEFVLKDAGIKTLITQLEYMMDQPYFTGNVIAIDVESAVINSSNAKYNTIAGPHSLAYIMYTSGSTGNPKGVLVEHRSVVRLVRENTFYTFTGEETLLTTGALSFDATTFEWWGTLLNGGHLIICPKEDLLDPQQIIQENNVNTIWLTAGWFHQLIDTQIDIFSGLKTVLAGGDKLSAPHINLLLNTYPHLQIINGYGPTENTTFSLTYTITAPLTKVLVGKPISNSTAYILDRYQQPVPIGITGEIHTGGDGLARAYLNNTALTAQKFLTTSYGRLYRTGDLGRWLPDGNIEFIGRSDNQIKIRGFRIEPGEIEAALLAHADITAAVINVYQTELVAYYIGHVEIHDLKPFLTQRLPSYMVPTHLIQLPIFPLNANGKVDRKQLPPPTITDGGNEYLAPRNATEEKLSALWQEILGKNKISITDNFFDLGGHSLRATRLASQIYKEFEIKIDLRTLFSLATLEEQAAYITQTQKQLFTAIPPAPTQQHYPLSSAQRRLWVLSQLPESNIAYNMAGIYIIEGTPNLVAFTQAFNLLIERHEMLRTVFVQDHDGTPKQKVLPALPFQVRYQDMRGEVSLLQQMLTEEIHQPFNHETGPLLRASLYQTSSSRWIFTYVMHHITSDGWSMGILIKELSTYYNALMNGVQPDKQTLPIHYKDYAHWQQTQLSNGALSIHKDYWLQQLSGELPILELPTDHLRPALKTYNGGQHTVALNEGIKTWCRQHDATLFMGLLSTVAILLHRYSGQEDMIIATPIAGREHPDMEEQIGCYLNTLPLRLNINGTATFHDVMAHIKQVTMDAYEHQSYPFDELIATLPLKRDLSRNALCDVMVILQNNESEIHAPKLEGLNIKPYEEIEFTAAKFDLLFEFNDINNQLELNIKYNTDLYNAETIRRMAAHLKRLLKLVISHSEQPVATINYLINKEQLQLLEGFNSKHPVRPIFQTLPDLFEEMVARYTDATALYSNNVYLSYNQLNEEANKLAHYLIQIYHPQPDDIIAINLKKSEWMIIALLGILKTGAAYLPVDPQYPQERISYILSDAGCKLVIDDTFLQDFKQKKQHYNKNNPQRESTPTDLAYVIYTSGSTGKPKGVMIEHKSIISYLRAIAGEYNFSNTERVLQLASIAFDAATEQVLLPLTHGASVYLAPAANPETLPAFISEHSITHVHAVPSLLKELNLLPSHELNRIVSAGEVCPRALTTKFDNVRFYNKYGPTEATISSTIFTGDVDYLMPIGHPLSHCSIYILDDNGLLCPIGVPGELCISGAAVARGYLHQPTLTAEKFVVDPFKPGEKMYRSGDIGYWLPDGNIVFTGRKDEQVKVRGYRIETGEIENCLRLHADIDNAVVIAVNNQDLAAYIVTSKQVTVAALRSFLAQYLPAYMIPAHYTALKVLPLTPNGKVNKKLLPLPGNDGLASGIEYIAPRNDTEEMVANIWKDLLGRDIISVKDNFFELGGHSLKATLLVSRINNTFSTKLSLQTIFKNPILEDLSGQIDFLLHQNEQKKNRENLIQIEL